MNAERMRISWTNPRQNIEHLLGFIRYRNSEIQASPEANISVSEAIGTHSAEIAGLLPNTEYEFYVCICKSAHKGVCTCTEAPSKGLTLPQSKFRDRLTACRVYKPQVSYTFLNSSKYTGYWIPNTTYLIGQLVANSSTKDRSLLRIESRQCARCRSGTKNSHYCFRRSNKQLRH